MEKSIKIPITLTIYFSRVLDKDSQEEPLDILPRMKELAPPCSSLDADIFQTSREERETDVVTEYTIILALNKEIIYETEGIGIAYHEAEEDIIKWARDFIRKVLPADSSSQQFEIQDVELSDCRDVLSVIQDVEDNLPAYRAY